MTHPAWPGEVHTRDAGEAATGERTGRDDDVSAEDDGEHEALTQFRVVVHELLEQADEYQGTLGVTDEDDRSVGVVVPQVVLEPGAQAVVGGHRRCGGGVEQRQGEQARQRDLAVHRSPDPADGGEPGRLGDCGVDLGGLHAQVGFGVVSVLTVG